MNFGPFWPQLFPEAWNLAYTKFVIVFMRKLLRPRLLETKQISSCQDQDQSKSKFVDFGRLFILNVE